MVLLVENPSIYKMKSKLKAVLLNECSFCFGLRYKAFSDILFRLRERVMTMKVIRKIISWILLVFIGVLIGVNYEYWHNITPKWVQEVLVPYETSENVTPTVEFPATEDTIGPEVVENYESGDINYQFIENQIIAHVNDLRQELEAQPVTMNETLREGAYMRAVETEESFSHTRPNGSPPFTVFTNADLKYNYRIIGENLAMATYFGSDESMAEFVFQGWVDSPDHYETMINPEFEEIGVGIHYDGEILYATQFFGKQQ